MEFEITPTARTASPSSAWPGEAAATCDVPLRLHEPVVKGGAEGDLMELLDGRPPAMPGLCPAIRMVRNVKIAPSQVDAGRLHCHGCAPINNIVDITNYVMLEYGQPMRNGYRYVKGGSRESRLAEEGVTTPGRPGPEAHRKPSGHRRRHRAVGLAGIMGGENSEIVADTVDVVFESANFDGTCIRKGALALGMRTGAPSLKRAWTPEHPAAVNRACELGGSCWAAGGVLDGVIDILNYVPQPGTIRMDPGG